MRLQDYGFLNTTMQSTLQTYFNGLLSCSASDTSCLNSLSLSDVLSAQKNLSTEAVNYVPAAGQAEPIRPVRDGDFITSPLDLTAAFPSQSKTIMLTNVIDEAMYTIYGQFPSPISASYYDSVVDYTFGSLSGSRLLSYQPYVPAAAAADGTQDARPQLSQMGTDQVWRCPTWTFARNWASNGGTAYVGMYTVGASYPGNSEVPECTDAGSVCHQDDIEIVVCLLRICTCSQCKADLTPSVWHCTQSDQRAVCPHHGGPGTVLPVPPYRQPELGIVRDVDPDGWLDGQCARARQLWHLRPRCVRDQPVGQRCPLRLSSLRYIERPPEEHLRSHQGILRTIAGS